MSHVVDAKVIKCSAMHAHWLTLPLLLLAVVEGRADAECGETVRVEDVEEDSERRDLHALHVHLRHLVTKHSNKTTMTSQCLA